MINVNGEDYYTAAEICSVLDMKYPSVIHLLRKNKIQKYDNKYIISKDELKKLRSRKNQTTKSFMLETQDWDED